MPGRKTPGKRNHAKGASKGQRWARGHSCVSNPSTTKFRDQASSNFLHPVSDNPLLTQKNVAAIQSQGGSDMDEDLTSEVDSLSISDISCGTGLSSISTLKSLSSAWSKCSTNAFDRFLKKFRSDSLVHKEMLSILAASSEVINGAGGKLNETEFFATFLTLLDSCQPDQYQPVMSLLCIVTPRVSPAVLKLKFVDIYPKIGTILSYAAENSNDLLLRSCIEAFMKLVRVQDRLHLEEDKQLQSVLYTVLKCTLHERPRVRKKARNAVKRFVSQNSPSSTSITKLTLGWILDQLSCFPTCDTKVVADVLTLLLSIWSSISSISKPGAKKLFEGVLRVMSSGDSNIMKIGFSFFIEVFENFTTISECDPQDELFSKLIVALWELQPDTRNTDCFVLWLRCILSGLVRLRQGPSEFDMSLVSSALESSSPLWITNHGKIITQLFNEFLPHLLTESVSQSILEKLFRVLSKNLLSVPPNLFALQILESVLESLTPSQYCTAAQDVFLQLIPLRHAQGVLPAMGRFIRAFGAEQLWTTVDPATRWLVILPLIQDNLHNAEILFWKKEILPGLGTKTKLDVGWASLVGFCRNPKDPESFPAELLGKTIVEKPPVRLQALAALRQFIEWPQCKEICQKYSKNYLPILFNLYIKTKPEAEKFPGHCDAVGTTIQKYLEHCDSQFVCELTSRALTKFTTEVDEAASPVFDLVAFLAVHVNEKELQEKLLEETMKKWDKIGDSKRSYRIIANLSKNKSLNQDIVLKLLETLKMRKAETKSNAAAIRLECISVITALNPEWLKDFLPEIIINLLSVNAKAKKLASSYVTRFCEYLKETQKDINSVYEIVRVGLSSPISLMVSCTLRFAFLLYTHLSPDSPSQELLEMSIARLLNHTDQVVWKHSLQFLSLNLQLYKGALGPVATQLGQIVSDLKYPKKDSTRLLARMIKVFGAVGVKAIVIDAEDPKMRNRIKNVCKKLREKSKKKEDRDKRHSNDEEDGDMGHDESSDDEMDIDVRMSNKTPLVMKEGVVDFLSPSDVAKSFINERPVKKADAFKLSKDGKLIIDTEDSKKSRKRSAPGDSSDDDEDEDHTDSMESDASDDDDALVQSIQKKSKSSGKSNMSAKSLRSSGSKFSMRSWKSSKTSASSRKTIGKRKNASVPSSKGKTKGIRRDLPGKINSNKRFKSSSSANSVKSGKSRKSSAASTFRLKF